MAWFSRWFGRERRAPVGEVHASIAAGRDDGAGGDREQSGHAIVLYGTPWCGDCRRAKRVFAEKGIAYTYVDIEDDPEATDLVMRLNRGMRSVPTIIFPDGSVLVEPGNAALMEKLATLAQ